MEILIIIIGASILSSIIVSFTLPKILLMSLKKRLIDPIDERKVHTSTASRLGGASFFPAIFISLSFCFTLAGYIIPYYNLSESFFEKMPLVLTALLMLFLTGFYDDVIGVRFREKFALQFIAASIITLSGTYLNGIYGINNSELFITFSPYVGIPLSILLIMFITNSINLIDGIDGLASMLSIMALFVYSILFALTNQYAEAAFCLAAMGALIPFWFHNVFGIRDRIYSKIFMGDSGSLVIGFTLGIMAIRLWNTDFESDNNIEENLSRVLSFTMLLVPCLDVLRVICHRFRSKKPLFLPDKNHIHHKFMAYGMTAKRALLYIMGIQISFLVINLLLSSQVNILGILAIDIILWVIFHNLMGKKKFNKFDNLNRSA